MKSVLMIGQSNMAGRGFINEVPMICNERIQMLRNGKWQMMTEPINYDRPISGVSLAGSFAAMWCMENKEEQIGLIPCAEGGSSIDDWSIEKILFKNAIIQAKFAMQNSNLIAILWHQGENDSYNGNYKTYYEKLHTIFEALKNELNLDDVPGVVSKSRWHTFKCCLSKKIWGSLLLCLQKQKECDNTFEKRRKIIRVMY